MSHARAARYPLKSLAAMEREARKAGANEEALISVLSTAADVLARENTAATEPPTAQWLSPTEAASALGVSLRWVREHLTDEKSRRLLGFPWYDGRRWHIPAAACNHRSRASYLDSLPATEPPENTAHLTGPAPKA